MCNFIIQSTYFLFIENGEVDEYSLPRMKKIKDELAKIKARLCETFVKPVKTLSKQKIAAILAAMKDEIFVKKIVTMSNRL